MAALSDDEQTPLRLVNELITTDPQAARALADRWADLVKQETATRAAADAQKYPQGTPDDAQPEAELEAGQ